MENALIAGSLQPEKSPGRVASIDAFRGLTILVMIFVNDVAGVKNTPQWLRHMDTQADGMTFVDLVFPAFLFIVGMSIPFALNRRLESGESLLRVWWHILVRTAGLLIVGVFMVNMPADSAAMGMNARLWTLLVYLGVIIVWNQYPRMSGSKRILITLFRMGGVALLAWLAMIYRGKGQEGEPVNLRHQWWGIVGLIGWAYLAAASLYILWRKQLPAMVGAIGLGTALFIAQQSGGLKLIDPVLQFVAVGPALGGHGSIVCAGIVVSMLFFPGTTAHSPLQKVRWILTFAAGLAIAGFWLRPLYGISKNLATPAWCLLSSAICCVLYAGFYWVMDVWGFKRWAVVIRPAGENPLLAYILPSIVLAALSFWPQNPYASFSGEPYPMGLIRPAVFTVFILALTWALGKARIRLRL